MFRSLVALILLVVVVSCVPGGVPPPRAAAPPTATATTTAAAALASAPATATNDLPGSGVPAALPGGDLTFVSLEGPFWVATPTGGYLLFSDVVEANGPGARIYKFDPTTRRFSIRGYPTGTAGGATSTNGLALDRDGALLACERYNGRLVRLTAGFESGGGAGAVSGGGAAAAAAPAKIIVLADHAPADSGHAGLPFNAPNDLVVRRDGNVYFTDSDWGARPGVSHGPMGVYRLSPRGKLTRVLALDKPNGVALSPDGATLYVGSDVQGKIWRLPVDAGGATGAPTLLVDGARVPGGFKVPDGICIDDAGRLYVTNNADDVKAIVAFDPDGRLVGRIQLPAAPSNCTFGGADRRTMYVTTLHAVYEIRMPTPGLP